MRRYSWLVALAFVFCMLRPAMSAPMFPDVPDMWAKDAVAALAAKGILEGYPDGTFKGDRAATRYEVAMIVARLMARIEQEEATFATKADLDELRRLVNQLKDELDALGVRVQNLEDNVAKLDKRVTELERITFYGSLDVRYVTQHFSNSGNSTGTNSLDAAAVITTSNGGVFQSGAGGPFPVATGLAAAFAPLPGLNPVTVYPSVLGAATAQSAASIGNNGLFFAPSGPFGISGQAGLFFSPFAPTQTAIPGTLSVNGTTGATAPIPGITAAPSC